MLNEKNENEAVQLTPIQEELLEVLKRIHALCTVGGIKYSMYAGTQLGAVRHKGFIPWDDDVDIIFKRNEYKKLTRFIKEGGLPPDLSFDDVIDRMPKFVLHRKDRPVAFVDVCIYDYISENPILQKVKVYMSLFLAAVVKSPEMIQVVRAKKQLTGCKYVVFYLVYLAGRIFPMRAKINFRNWFCEHIFSGRRTMVYCSNTLERHIKQSIRSDSTLQSYTELPFEDTTLMSFENYGGMLTDLYGPDYMTPKRYPDTEAAAHDLFRKIMRDKWSSGERSDNEQSDRQYAGADRA